MIMKTNEDQSTQITALHELVREKCSLKQDVYEQTQMAFRILKGELNEVIQGLSSAICESDQRINLHFNEQGDFESVVTIGGDAIVFHMHSNVFTFPQTHMIHKNPYVKGDPNGAYFGVINIYNFLSDSFKYRRVNDLGYMIARIFVNQHGHFFIEGKGRLNFDFNDLSVQKVEAEAFKRVVLTALKYVMEFDLFTPPYQAVKEVSLMEVLELNNNMKMKTAKRLGFRFEGEEDANIQF